MRKTQRHFGIFLQEMKNPPFVEEGGFDADQPKEWKSAWLVLKRPVT